MTIMRLGIGLVLVAALAMPTTASAEVSPNDFKNAAKYCKALRAEIGVDAFRDRFGSNDNKRNAFGKCVSKQRKGKNGLVRVSRAECNAEYAADPAAFLVRYGEPAASRRPDDPGSQRPEKARPDKPSREVKEALARCVRAKVKALVAERIEALKNAAQTCKEERAADPAAFRAEYGSNHNKRNAFGKCVVRHLRAGSTTPTS
jgi:hypothetical protein